MGVRILDNAPLNYDGIDRALCAGNDAEGETSAHESEVLVLYQKRSAEEELGSRENVRRSLLIQRLEGSRWRLRRTRSAMGFESTLGWKLLY
jgi:hypothetical protein